MNTELSQGALIGRRYRLDALIGEGGMGAVWAATHMVTRQRVALKLLKTLSSQRQDHRRRFWREARAASTVQHPNVVRIHDLFELEDDTLVMVMDLLTGETLGQRLRSKGQLSLEETASYLVPAVSAVGSAHALGIVHRDLKPDNIFLVDAGGSPEVRVLDFGIAKLTIGDDGAPLAQTITNTGAMLGTPYYMSPEQGLGERDVDHRTDIWAFGVILFEALAGARPVEGENLGQVIKRLISDAIMPLEAVVPDLPGDVSALVRRMLSRDRNLRPQDLREVQAVLERHTATRAPAFGPPSTEMKESDQELVPGPVRVVVNPSPGDPERATASGSGAPNTADPTSSSIIPRRRSARVALWATFIVIVGLTAWGLRAATQASRDVAKESPSAADQQPATEKPSSAVPPKYSVVPGAPADESPEERSLAAPSTSVRHPANAEKARTLPARSPAAASSTPRVGASAAGSAKEPVKRPNTQIDDGLVDDPPF